MNRASWLLLLQWAWNDDKHSQPCWNLLSKSKYLEEMLLHSLFDMPTVLLFHLNLGTRSTNQILRKGFVDTIALSTWVVLYFLIYFEKINSLSPHMHPCNEITWCEAHSAVSNFTSCWEQHTDMCVLLFPNTECYWHLGYLQSLKHWGCRA